MDTFVRKQLTVAITGVLFLAFTLPLHGYQEPKLASCGPIKHTRKVARQAQTIQMSVDRYLQGLDDDIHISAKKQHSIVWTCSKCTFLIKSIVPDPNVKDLPERVRKHLERFSRGPFYREFPDEREEEQYSNEVATGPVRRTAAPGRNVPLEPQSAGPAAPKGAVAAQYAAPRPSTAPAGVDGYPFKATFWIKRPGMPDCELDPHIKTVEGTGPDQ